MMRLLMICLMCLCVMTSCANDSTPVDKAKIDKIKQCKTHLDAVNEYDILELGGHYALWPFYDLIIGNSFVVGIVSTSTFRAYAWTREGKFLGEIGELGRGPGEYMSGETGLFLDDDTFMLFDNYLLRASTYNFTNQSIEFVDLTDFSQLNKTSINKAYLVDDKIYCFNTAGHAGTHRLIVTNKNLEVISKHFPRKHTAYAKFELYYIHGDKIYMTDEIYHKNVDSIKRDVRHPENMGKLLICDLAGNVLKRIKFDDSELISDIIPDPEKQTIYLGNMVIDYKGNTIQKLSNQVKLNESNQWLSESNKLIISRHSILYADRSMEGKLRFHLYKYEI